MGITINGFIVYHLLLGKESLIRGANLHKNEPVTLGGRFWELHYSSQQCCRICQHTLISYSRFVIRPDLEKFVKINFLK